MQVKHQDLFPTRVWLFEAPELLEHGAAWTEHVHAWRERHPVPAGRSNRRGWNSDKTVFSHELFAPLLRSANSAFLHAFGEMKLAERFRFRLEGWINLHDTGSYNSLHAHPHALLSGCYYLQAPPGSGQIVFRDPRAGVVLSPFEGQGVNCGATASMAPKPGQLLVFPHWLEHLVDANEASEPRISISMNAIQAP